MLLLGHEDGNGRFDRADFGNAGADGQRELQARRGSARAGRFTPRLRAIARRLRAARFLEEPSAIPIPGPSGCPEERTGSRARDAVLSASEVWPAPGDPPGAGFIFAATRPEKIFAAVRQEET